MAWGSKRSGGGGVAWLALLVALAALFLSWKAYQRTGGELEDILHAPVGNAEETVDREADLAEARGRLLQRRTEVAARSGASPGRRDPAASQRRAAGSLGSPAVHPDPETLHGASLHLQIDLNSYRSQSSSCTRSSVPASRYLTITGV